MLYLIYITVVNVKKEKKSYFLDRIYAQTCMHYILNVLSLWGCSYSCATVYLQMHQFGIFSCVVFTIILVIRLLTCFVLLVISTPVRKKCQR